MRHSEKIIFPELNLTMADKGWLINTEVHTYFTYAISKGKKEHSKEV